LPPFRPLPVKRYSVSLSRDTTAMIDRIQDLLDRHLSAMPAPRVLEAGCGSAGRLRFPAAARLTGVDISPEQLAAHTALHDAVLADLETWDPPADAFDAIVCWDVLEHLPRPVRALERLAAGLRPGGILVLGLPHVLSLKGLVTKCTPHAVHVWVYRRLLGDPLAGGAGHAPFRAYHRLVLRPASLRREAARLGLRVDVAECYRHDFMEWTVDRRPLLRALWTVAAAVVRIASFGRIETVKTDVVLVLRKEAPPPR
jgi:SAM-dependent methyltransferase